MSKATRLLERMLAREDLRLRSLQRISSLDPVEARRKIGSARITSRIHTGTTVVAMHYDGGVLMAADRQVTSGYGLELFHDYVKIERFEELYSLLGMAGTVSYAQELMDQFLQAVDSLSDLINAPIYIDGQAQILSHIMRVNSYEMGILQELLEYIAVPIIAGWDPENDEGLIYSFDSAGAKYDLNSEGYGVVGSGSDFARTILDDRWRYDLDQEEAILLALRAIVRSSHRDTFTSDPLKYPITVYLAENAGTYYIEDEALLNLATSLYIEDMQRRNGGGA